MNDDSMDAMLYAMKHFSPTGREVVAKSYMAQERMGKSQAIQAWSDMVMNEVRRKPLFANVIDDIVWRSPEGAVEMRAALRELKSKHLADFIQMSSPRKGAFIRRVERHGRGQYPNQQHMRDLYALYINKRVFNALKD